MMKTLTPRQPLWPLVAIVLVAAGVGGACRERQPAAAQEQTPADRPGTGAVGALGRIEPADGIVHVAARSLGGQPSIVAAVTVKAGDPVKAGQLIAELDSKRQLQAALRQAAARIEVARRRLAQVSAGAKASEVNAQRAEVERLRAEAANARKEQERYASLGTSVTELELDRLRLRVESGAKALVAAEERLASLTDVREVDVALARAELEEAIRNQERAQAEHDASMIYSPIDGRVLKIHARPGETVGADGLMELARVEPMYAVAEVAESDLGRVRVGQRARISGEGLRETLVGRVERIDARVLQNQLLPVDPANFSDSRVVEVWTRIDDSRAVADLIHLRVNVVIEPEP
jgi:HlyD family secretion protein